MRELVYRRDKRNDNSWIGETVEYKYRKVPDNYELTEDDIDKNAMARFLNDEDYEDEEGINYNFEVLLRDERGFIISKVGMWLSEYFDEIADKGSVQELVCKAKEEYALYKEELRKLPAREIVDKSFETFLKGWLVDLFSEKMSVYPEEKVKALIDTDNLLERIYIEWSLTGISFEEPPFEMFDAIIDRIIKEGK